MCLPDMKPNVVAQREAWLFTAGACAPLFFLAYISLISQKW